MKDNVWAAQSLDSFNPHKYVYHYTSFETALKILYGDTFLFSPFSRTNDTAEQKSRIAYDFDVSRDMEKAITAFEEYWLRWGMNSQMLCFSRDRENRCPMNRIRGDNRFEMSGRGFALPRMWAQYGATNSGVCLIIQKDELIKRVRASYPFSRSHNVKYLKWNERYQVKREIFDEISNIISHDPDSTFAPDFLQANPLFEEYTFFTKNNDWSGENEFRIVIPSTHNNRLQIEGVKSMLAGIVVGESIPDAYVGALFAAVPNTHMFRKIFFELAQCRIKHIDDIQWDDHWKEEE